VHSVYFYDTDTALVDRLCAIVKSALDVDNSALLVVTPAHCVELLKELRRRRIDIRAAEMVGRLTILDARSTLDTFMVNGRPDPARFLSTVGQVINSLRDEAAEESKGLSVFGEMVSVLWQEGNRAAALELESLWNDALNMRPFYLHCAYPRRSFTPGVDVDEMASICRAHSHVLGTVAPAA